MNLLKNVWSQPNSETMDKNENYGSVRCNSIKIQEHSITRLEAINNQYSKDKSWGYFGLLTLVEIIPT